LIHRLRERRYHRGVQGGDPYRTAPEPAREPQAPPPREEAAAYVLAAAIGAIPVAGAVASGAAFGAAATVGLGVSALGLAGLVRYGLAARRARTPTDDADR
jgi:hypothetical protein